MRSLLVTAALATAALALAACQNKRRPEPVPPPQSGQAASQFSAADDAAPDHGTTGAPCPSRRLFSF